MKRTIFSLLAMALVCAMTLTSCKKDSDVEVTAVKITGFPSPFIMEVGDEVTLNVEVLPSDASDKKVTWFTSDPTVATIDQAGKVVAVGEGTAAIKVVAANSKENVVDLTVMAPVAKFISHPVANTEPVYAGSDTPLLLGGEISGGTMMYAVSYQNTKPELRFFFSKYLTPKSWGLDVGINYVWYYAKGDEDHEDSEIFGPIEVNVLMP